MSEQLNPQFNDPRQAHLDQFDQMNQFVQNNPIENLVSHKKITINRILTTKT